jgi:hypothetical protein
MESEVRQGRAGQEAIRRVWREDQFGAESRGTAKRRSDPEEQLEW